MVLTVSARRPLFLGSLVMLLAMISACGKGAGTARLQFAQSTATALGLVDRSNSMNAPGNLTATSFKKKLIAAYLAENVDLVTQNNVGKTSMFWLNSECSEDISNCNAFSPDASGATSAHVVTSFFDFTDLPTTNALLNSQGRSIDAGTYRYVRLEFCKYGPPAGNDASTGQHNIEWAYNDGTTTTSGKLAESSCGVTSALTSPIEVKDKDSVTVTLTYSLTGTVTADAGCTGGYCFAPPEFIPSASK